VVYLCGWWKLGNRGASYLHIGDGGVVGQGHYKGQGYCQQEIRVEAAWLALKGDWYVVSWVFWQGTGY